MAGLPTLLVDIGPAVLPGGSGASADISTYAHLPEGHKINRGRGDEESSVSPGTLELCLDNTDGRFTLGSTLTGITIDVDTPIRVRETVGANTYSRFAGYVQEWPVNWPDGADTRALVKLTATDEQARMVGATDFRSAVVEEIMSMGPVAFYPLDDATGQSSAKDIAGVGAASLKQAGINADVTFGVGIGALFAGGKRLEGDIPDATVDSSVVLVLEATIKTPLAPSSTVGVAGVPGFAIHVNTAGKAVAYCDGVTITGTTTVTDDQEHRIAVTFSANVFSGCDLWVDGAIEASTGPVAAATVRQLRIGDSYQGVNAFDGEMAYVAVTSCDPLIVDIPSHVAAAAGFPGETSSDRVVRLAGYKAPEVVVGAETGVQTMPALTLEGTNVWSEIQASADAEGGLAFISAAGILKFHNRRHRSTQTTPDVTMTAAEVNDDLLGRTDKQGLVNYAEGTRPGGTTQVASNKASILAHGQHALDGATDLRMVTDDEVRDFVWWHVNTRKDVAPRFSQITVDLLTTASTALVQALLATEIGDRIRITGLPSQMPGGTSIDLVVEGITENLTHEQWEIQFNTSPWAYATAWVLDEATQSQLGTTTRLGY